jgi:hypothetical protein
MHELIHIYHYDRIVSVLKTASLLMSGFASDAIYDHSPREYN